MAQKKRKRKSRHRGTAAGTIEARGRTSRPAEASTKKKKPTARSQGAGAARDKRAARFDEPPTWRGALNRALFAAGLFGILMLVAFRRPIASAAALASLMVFMYLPMSYYTDRFLYNRRQRQK